ncbi:helix-turn-helix transcriptional regulator [Serratia marcescens]|uniref:helix-turn-helix transcriptional regulator n=1 Tax=Serratia marcescens TaxID=615 RepID=UPI003D178965
MRDLFLSRIVFDDNHNACLTFEIGGNTAMNNISQARKKAGITQHQLAEALGWSQSRIGNYEAGTRNPDLSSCRKIVDVLNSLGAECSLDSVFPPKKFAAEKA